MLRPRLQVFVAEELALLLLDAYHEKHLPRMVEISVKLALQRNPSLSRKRNFI